jgi:hypothetical protein
VDSDFFAPRIRCDYGEGKHRDTETGADTANDSVKRPKFQLVDQGNSSCAQEAFETLTVRAPYSEDEELMNAPFPQRSFQRAMLGRTYQHEFFHENESRLQIIMLNRSGDERSVQPILENGLNEISRCARLHRNIHVSMRRCVRFQYRR